jgi:hypothetical protein
MGLIQKESVIEIRSGNKAGKIKCKEEGIYDGEYEIKDGQKIRQGRGIMYFKKSLSIYEGTWNND